MRINEMEIGSLVSIHVKNKEGREVTLETQVAGAYEAGGYSMVLVEPLRHNGQLLVFHSVMCEAMITNIENGMLYKFKLQAIVKREQDDKVYHCLISNDDASEENRRSAKRFGVGEKANIQVLGGTTAMRGHVLDISVTGIAVLVGDAKLLVGDRISVSFMHEITGIQVKVIAQVVRQQEHDKGVKFGCVIQKHDAKYNMLISYLMRQECKVRS